jgi:hypothetical protein
LGRVESIELAHGLGGKGFTIHEEQDATSKFAFEQAVDLRDG